MPDTMTYTSRLTIITCYKCAIVFAMPDEFNDRCLRDHSISFSCPQGHSQHYIGKTEEQKAKERAAQSDARASALRDQLAASERSKSALKGQITKTKRRIANGVCPCCNRHFVNVERHMHNQHPDYTEA